MLHCVETGSNTGSLKAKWTWWVDGQVDPHSKNQGKIEDEVPALFKRLRYPYTISKSALFAVGSPHTWPGLLAALVWLTELLYYEEKAVRAAPCAATHDTIPRILCKSKSA